MNVSKSSCSNFRCFDVLLAEGREECRVAFSIFHLKHNAAVFGYTQLFLEILLAVSEHSLDTLAE